jgi:hypothetical protein
MVIVEQRDYHVTTGKLPELVRLYETEGIAIQAEVLGGFLGAFTTDVGALSTYTSSGAGQLRRARSAVPPAGARRLEGVPGEDRPLIHTQQNRILTPTPFS